MRTMGWFVLIFGFLTTNIGVDLSNIACMALGALMIVGSYKLERK